MPGEDTRSTSLVSTLSPDGDLRVELRGAPVPAPGPDEVVIRIEACAINPSDMSLMLGPVDMATLEVESAADGRNALVGRAPADRLQAFAQRLGQPVPIGNEGAGTIVAAGSEVAHLLGAKCAAFLFGGTFSTYRLAKAADVTPLPAEVEPAEAAAMFVNPLTALAMLETMRRDGRSALVHTAAASNLGQMLVRLCRAEGVPLVNVVRREEQVALLHSLGAEFVVNSSGPDFPAALAQALAAGATLLFDAVGGGDLTDRILHAMEAVAVRALPAFSRYGSQVHKQAYVYSNLAPGVTELGRTYGMTWSVSPYSLPHILQTFGPQALARMKARVLEDIRSVFASAYAGTVGLTDLFDVELIRRIARRATGSKYLLDPRRA